MSPAETGAVVSHEQDGRVLSGVGVTADALAQTMDRHTPEEAQAPAADPIAPVPAAPAEPELKGRARFTKLAADAKQATERAEAAEREKALLEARLTQAAAAPSPVAAAPASVAAPVVTAPATRQKPTEGDIGTKYQSYADFVEDLSDWKAEQRLQAIDFDGRVRQTIDADRASRSFTERVAETHAKARAIYPDFDAVWNGGPGAGILTIPQQLQAIIQHPQSEHLQYAILKDAAVAQRLAALPPIEFGLALAQLVPSGAATAPAAPAHAVVAPAPFQPVGTGSKTTVTPSSELAKHGYDFDKSGYREKRAAERGMTRR